MLEHQHRYQHLDWNAIPADAPMPGLQRRMVVGDSLMICHLTFAPRIVTPVHRHPHEQMTLVERGRVLFTIEGAERIAGPGEVLHFPSGIFHGATMLDEEVVLMDIFTPIREDFLQKTT
jgi:quercetin dioxygenase-like cupin family protein